MAKKKDKTYRAGAYKRLSQDDGRGEVSNSIINQTELIKDYGKSHSEIEIVAEYDDDGYSGTNFDRPGFLRMMEDCRKGRIDRILVKSISRFGRNTRERLKAVRELAGLGVIVLFEEQKIDTAETTGEMLTASSMLPTKTGAAFVFLSLS